MFRRKLTPEEEDDLRFKKNPFEERDEKDGVDLKNPDSPRNSFLEEEELDFPDDEEEVEDDDDVGGLIDMDPLW